MRVQRLSDHPYAQAKVLISTPRTDSLGTTISISKFFSFIIILSLLS